MSNENAPAAPSDGKPWRIDEWFADISAEKRAKIREFFDILLMFNAKINLISPKTEKSADLVHFADGILGAQSIFKMTNKREIFDIGSGNGIPGIIMAILDPNRIIKLVDTDARKIEFLKFSAGRLALKNCLTIHARLQDLAPKSVSCAVSRGFASLSKTLLAARQAAAPECEYFHFKGQNWSSEVAEIPSQILAAWEAEHVSDYKLPSSDATMAIVVTRRV